MLTNQQGNYLEKVCRQPVELKKVPGLKRAADNSASGT